MKLIKIFQRLKLQVFIKLLNNEIFITSLLPLSIVALFAEAVWIGGPYITWAGYAPIAQPEKRIYIILCLFLVWLLKFLIIDLDIPNPFQYQNPKVRSKLQELQNRFYGAMQFLRKTIVSKQGKSICLNELPWYLMIGPANSGKTTLLAMSGVNFILQRQFQKQGPQELGSSENCDWWVTRESSIIDIPGKYLTTNETSINQKSPLNTILWQFFLRLVKKQRGKNGVSGIIITLPLPEMMKQSDTKTYSAHLHDLFQRLHELRNMFPQRIPCQLVITKCDLLPGFTEFFSDLNNEEIIQAWGVTLPASLEKAKISDAFTHHFNALIKRLNQQLIWRLHQERNPMIRPYIKDFPFQVERLKEFALDFIKKFVADHLNLSLQGVYLTSSFQPKPETETQVLDQTAHATTRAVQLFKEPSLTTRAYFVKQFFTHGLAPAQIEHAATIQVRNLKRYPVYAVSIGTIVFITIMLGQDFQRGIHHAYAIQRNLSDYQISIAQMQDPDEHLIRTLKLLNLLQQSVKETGFQLDLSHFMSFYTDKSQQKINEVYHHALQTILLPEIKNYFEYYLQNPINKNADDIYTVLKAYLMLGDPAHFDADYVASAMQLIQPKAIQNNDSKNLMQHMMLTLNSNWRPLTLDTRSIKETRRFLTGLPGAKLGSILLKNIDSNNAASGITQEITLGNPSIFVNQQMVNPIPVMFTAKAFTPIVSQEISLAAQEATLGNWVLGNEMGAVKNPTISTTLVDQLRTNYVNNYIDVWESLLANIHLSQPSDLAQIDKMIVTLISNNSPLLQLLQTLHDNTYFDPIASSSPKLQSLGILLEKNAESQNLLYGIFASLQTLHQYLQTVLTAEDEEKAAFTTVSNRMLNPNTPDAITQLRLIAGKSPDPIKNWLEQIANDSWNALMHDSVRYIDTSWQNHVIRFYQADIADHYPFASNANQNHEVDIKKFIDFFGNPGIVMNFYNDFLRQFIDTSNSDWHWKKIDNQKLGFSDETLRQIQHAMRIHHSFFPNGDNKLYVEFALQPYQFGKNIKRVKLSINDKQFIDEPTSMKNSHVVAWPNNSKQKMTYLQFTLTDHETFSRRFPGNWGWHKLVNQSFESMITKKEFLINLSMNEQPVKYLLLTDGRYNPLSLNLSHFHLPQQLTDNKRLL